MKVRGITSWRADEGAEWIEVDGTRVPSRFVVTTTVDFEWVDMQEVDEEGRPVYVPEGRHRPYERVTYVVEDGALIVDEYEMRRWPGLNISDTRLGGRGLEEMGRRALDSLAKGPGGSGFRSELGLTTQGERRARRRALDGIKSGAVGRPALADDEVRAVADVYRAAQAEGKPPGKAVEAYLVEILGEDVDGDALRARAQRRIRRARQDGLLPPFVRGKAKGKK